MNLKSIMTIVSLIDNNIKNEIPILRNFQSYLMLKDEKTLREYNDILDFVLNYIDLRNELQNEIIQKLLEEIECLKSKMPKNSANVTE